jgi:hypothetical protein
MGTKPAGFFTGLFVRPNNPVSPLQLPGPDSIIFSWSSIDFNFAKIRPAGNVWWYRRQFGPGGSFLRGQDEGV